MGQAEIISEQWPHKVSAVFRDADRAKQAATALEQQVGLSDGQIELVRPNDPEVERKVEPESGHIFRTILRSHALLGLAGLVAGLILAAVLVGMGLDFAQSRPGWVFILAGTFGAVVGLLLAGLVSARPDHEPAIVETEEASEHGQWSVVVHARDEDEKRRADEVLESHATKVRESL